VVLRTAASSGIDFRSGFLDLNYWHARYPSCFRLACARKRHFQRNVDKNIRYVFAHATNNAHHSDRNLMRRFFS